MKTFRATCKLTIFTISCLGLILGLALIRLAVALGWLREDAGTRAVVTLVHWGCRLLARVCGIVVRMPPNLQWQIRNEDKCLIISNHVSYVDIIVAGSLAPSLFLSKTEVRHWPLLGWAARLARVVFVDRTDCRDRLRALYKLRDSLRTTRMVVFPEGTTTVQPWPCAGNWQRGNAWAAVTEDAAVFALGIRYQDQKEIAWVDDDAFAGHLWSFFRRPRTEVFLEGGRLFPSTWNGTVVSQMGFQAVVGHCASLDAALNGRRGVYLNFL